MISLKWETSDSQLLKDSWANCTNMHSRISMMDNILFKISKSRSKKTWTTIKTILKTIQIWKNCKRTCKNSTRPCFWKIVHPSLSLETMKTIKRNLMEVNFQVWMKLERPIKIYHTITSRSKYPMKINSIKLNFLIFKMYQIPMIVFKRPKTTMAWTNKWYKLKQFKTVTKTKKTKY